MVERVYCVSCGSVVTVDYRDNICQCVPNVKPTHRREEVTHTRHEIDDPDDLDDFEWAFAKN